jgi:predicted PurR-regulated permease PerM
VSIGSDDQSHQGEVPAAAEREGVAFNIPSWLRKAGVASWLTLGVVALVAVVLLVLAVVTEVAIPLAIAGVLAAVLVPLTDWLERWHVPRWLGATLVLVLGLSLAAGTIALVIGGIVAQSDEIWKQLESGLLNANDDLGGREHAASTLVDGAHDVVHTLTSGVVGSLVSSAGVFVIGAALALFMLLFLLKDWDQIMGWIGAHLGVPAPIGHRIVDGTATAFRGYAWGLTLLGVANAVVVGIGAWILGVPLAGTIALVSFVTSYVPYLGAFVAGAFAVLIAYGSGGLGTAVVMLAIVLLANSVIQNLLEPFALGTRLRLHPFAVLITVTSAAALFGVLGAVLAVPLVSAAVNVYGQLRAAGSLGHPPGEGADA